MAALDKFSATAAQTNRPAFWKSRLSDVDAAIKEVKRTWELSDKFEDFKAPSDKAAMKIFLDSLKKYLKRVAS